MGKILHIDLGKKDITTEELDSDLISLFIGGYGINQALAFKYLKPKVDPFSEENVVIFGAGLFAGTMVPGAPKVSVLTKSPANDAIVNMVGSMGFAAHMNWTGHNHIVLSGKSPDPVYIEILDDKVELKKADHLWSKGLIDVSEELKKKYGHCSVLAIGPAGENLVHFSLTLIDSVATLGRGGLGAVLGSKKVKAIVVKGTRGYKISDSTRFKKASDSIFKRVFSYPARKLLVTEGYMTAWQFVSTFMMTDNCFKVESPEVITKFFGPDIYHKLKVKRIACLGCPLGDKESLEIKDGPFKGLKTYSNTYLSIAIIGIRLGITDYAEAMKLMTSLDQFGLCKQTFECIMDFVTELNRKGIIDGNKLSGLPLERGLKSAMEWAKKIALREGAGDKIANGWRGVLDVFGSEMKKYAPISKNMDYVFDPRALSMGTTEFVQIINPRGPVIASGGSKTFSPPGTVPIKAFKRDASRMGMEEKDIERVFANGEINIGASSKHTEDWWSLMTSLGICTRGWVNRFYNIDNCAELFSALTGIEYSGNDLMKAAERSITLYKVLNVREGFSRKDDEFPELWFQPLQSGDKQLTMMDYPHKKKLERPDLEKMLDEYYMEKGWDVESGCPTAEALSTLGLEEYVKYLP